MLDMSSLGISASVPAVNERDIQRKTTNQYSGKRSSMEGRFDSKIAEVREQGAQETRALEGQMGTGRRFSSSAQSFLKFIGDENDKKIAELEVQKEDALTEFDFKLAGLIETKIANARQERRSQFEDVISMLEIAEKQNMAAAEKQKAGIQSGRDTAIAGLVTQGVTDPSEILQLVNFDEKGEQIGDFTAEEIGKTLESLSISGSKNISGDLASFQWLQRNNRLPSAITALPEQDQYFAYLNMQKLANAGKLGSAASAYGGGGGLPLRPGTGVKNGTEESIVRTRLFAKLATILNKGTLSDADRQIIDARIAEFRNAGMSEQQIMSALAGFPTDVVTPYNDSFISIAAANTDSNEKQQTLMAKLGQLMAEGNHTSAMQAVENAAFTNAKTLDPSNYIGQATATTYLKNIGRIRDIINGANAKGEIRVSAFSPFGAPGGPIAGSFQNIMGRFKSAEATKLKAELTNLYASFRKENLGSAVTPSESAFLEPLFADITDTKGNFMEKLGAFERQLLQRYNSTRESVNLPTATAKQATDPKARLDLYAGPSAPLEQQGGTIEDFLAAPVPSGASWDMAPDL